MQPPDDRRPRLDDDAFRDALRGVLARSGRSMRSLSLAMGRDPGYVAALLDPTRPSRARPTPDDLLALSDATGIALVELFEALWAIPPDRLAEFGPLESGRDLRPSASGLSAADRRTVADLVEFLVARRQARTASPSGSDEP